LVSAVAAVIAFVLALTLCASFLLSQAYLTLNEQRQVALDKLTQRAEAAFTGFSVLNQLRDRDRCTETVVKQLRQASFAPDGINEFLLLGNDRVLCTSSLGPMVDPYRLPEPQFTTAYGARFWFDVDLAPFGHRGDTGTLLAQDEFAAILPAHATESLGPAWLSLEGVVWAPEHVPHHINGTRGIFEENRADERGLLSTIAAPLSGNICHIDTRYCVAARISLSMLFLDNVGWILLAGCFAALIGNFVYWRSFKLIGKYLSFEARFRRNFRQDRILCSYQPIYDTAARRICGCEVLARWRDIDGSIVYPDRFLPVLEAEGRMAEFNRMIVSNAYAELSLAVPRNLHLQVNFNISPSSIKDRTLPSLFDCFLSEPERFSVVVEIVENEKVNYVDAEAMIQALRQRGIKTYIDDFGAGYSNMENLARLSADAVKLDKSFALAPPNTLMAEMLDFAIRMVHGLGRTVVVEGVETAERMEQLTNGPLTVHFLQGYFIARPLDVWAFVAFLEQRQRDAERPLLQLSA
jgi:sensor c-di-GMP phosphodiesterase-like protein